MDAARHRAVPCGQMGRILASDLPVRDRACGQRMRRGFGECKILDEYVTGAVLDAPELKLQFVRDRSEFDWRF